MHPKLAAAMPLLEHGDLISSDGDRCALITRSESTIKGWITVLRVPLGHVIDHPERYTIHREPKAVFITVSPGGSSISSYDDLASAMRFVAANPSFSITRYVEDLTWKPS